MDHLYQNIWNEDEHFLTVSGRDNAGLWSNEDADILLDEQVRASGSRQIDLATRPLFHQVNEAKLTGDLYQCFKALLNNYVVNYRDPETTSPQEKKEIDAFLDVALATRPMQIAFDYVSSVLVSGMTADDFRSELFRIWFEPFTNHFRGRSTHFCTGFEHVFVGEGKFNPREGAAASRGKISGYHNWLKFYLDEKAERVNFLGYKYDLNGKGPDTPHVVTMQFMWNLIGFDGEIKAELIKTPRGGFFVGSSPAAELAMATVAYFEGHHGLLDDQKRRVTLAGANFDLVMYHETLQDGGRGKHIRSFFPILLGAGLSPDGGGSVRPVTSQEKNDGPLRISSALPNPAGDDIGHEWVEIQNTSDAEMDLKGYELRDKAGRPQPIPDGQLASNEVLRVAVTRAHPNMLQLSNRAGVISLHDGSGAMLATVRYGRAHQGELITF